MRDKLTSFFLSASSGTATYYTTDGQEIVLAIVMAFIFGLIGLFGNECGKWVVNKVKKRKKHEKQK